MKKNTPMQSDPDLLEEYDFSKGLRGKYAQDYAEGSNIVVLSPDIADIFTDSKSVNEALRTLVRIAQQTAKKNLKGADQS